MHSNNTFITRLGLYNIVLVLLRLRQSLLRSITIDLSKKNRDVDVDSMSHGHVD